jgi:hypothetical protein
MTKEDAFAVVKAKVVELKAAVAVLNDLHPDGNVGLDEWCEKMDDVIFDLEEDLLLDHE